MIEDKSFVSKDALRLTNDAVLELVLRAELMGLSMLGEAIRIKEDAHIGTMCTDGRSIWVSPTWLAKNGHRGNIFDLLHEWLHCFCNHVARCGDRDKSLWNKACDITVVGMACEILTRPGDTWEPPKDGVIPPPWAVGLSTEEIYDRLKADCDKAKSGSGGSDGLAQSLYLYGKNPSGGEIHQSKDFNYESLEQMSPVEEADFAKQFTDELAQAQLIMEMSTGKNAEERYGSRVASRLGEVLKGTVPWSRLLRGDLVDRVSKQFASWSPPRMRYYPYIPLPSYRSKKTKRLFLGIDVSASVGKKMMDLFIANVMPAALRAEETIIVTFDEIIREEIVTRRPRQILNDVKFLQGAHNYTDVRPVFERIDHYDPSAASILTDAYLKYPDKPRRDVIWVVPRNAGKPPWGKTYTMEESW